MSRRLPLEEKTTAMIRDDTRNVFSVAELVGYESPISGNGRVLVWLRGSGDHPTRILPARAFFASPSLSAHTDHRRTYGQSGTEGFLVLPM